VNNLSRTLVLCSTLILTACAEDDPQTFIEEGKVLFEKGSIKEAQVQFKNALQIQAKSPEALYGLALIAEKKADWKAMARNLGDLLVLDPNHVDAHSKLGLLIIGNIDKAKEHAAIALKLDPENIDALLLDGRIKHKEKNNADALSQIDRVLAKDALNADAVWLQATIFISDKRYDEALEILNRTIEARSDSDDVGLDMLRIRLYKEQEKYDEVIRGYDELIAKRPDDKVFRYNQIEILSRFGKPEVVEKKLLEAIAEDPDDTKLKLAFVDFIERTDSEKTEDLLKKYIAEKPEELDFKTRLAGFYIGNNRNSDAKEVLSKIVEADSTGEDGLTAKVRLAEIVWKEGDKKLAEKLANEVLGVDVGNSSALLFRAGIYLSNNDPDRAVADLRIVLRDQPNSDQAMAMLAQADMLKGEPEVAESNWRKALEVNPGNQSALMSLVTVLLKRGDTERAEALLLKSLANNPESISALDLLVKIRASKKDWAGAEAAVNKMKKLPQAKIAAQLLEGLLTASQGRHQEAIQIYSEILKQKPGNSSALMSMAKSYGAMGRHSDYVVFLKASIEEKPENILAYNALSLAYVADKKWADAEKILKQALKVNSKALATYRLLITVLTQQGRDAEVVELYQKSMLEFPDNVNPMLGLAGFYEGKKDYVSAISAYKALLEKFPNNDLVANNLAALLLNSKDQQEGVQQALSLATRLKDSTNPYFLDTYGWVLLKAGLVNQSVDVLKKVIEVSPEIAVFHYHLGESYYASGASELAKAGLERSIKLAEKDGSFDGIERARLLLKEISASVSS